jgi:DNA-binding beta-propeller fold protein YncE
VFASSFGEPGSGSGQLSGPQGVAVDEATGDVYVVDRGNDRVEYFTSAGTYLGQFDGSGLGLGEGQAAPTGRFSGPDAIAIDNDPSSPSYGDVYVADEGHGVIDKYTSAGAYVGQIVEGSGGVHLGRTYGISVDAAGLLWVYQESNEVDDYSGAEANELIGSRQSQAFGPSFGFAVDSNDNLYIKNGFVGVNKLNGSGELLIQEFDSLFGGEPPTGIAVDLSTNDVYIADADGEGSVGRFASNDSLVESFAAERLVHPSGVGIDSNSGVVYVADSTADMVDVFVLEPAGAPTVEGQTSSNVTGGSATFEASVNPRGASTEYRFEYGRCPTVSACSSSGYEESSAEVAIGSEFGGQHVSVHVQDLDPGSVYHFRVVAVNQHGTTTGREGTIVTQTVGQAQRLPDERAWEMVSPPHKEGAQLGTNSDRIVEGAADGNAFLDWASVPTDASSEGSIAGTGGVNVFFGRGPTGWVSETIAPRHSAPPYLPPVGQGTEYWIFSEDLSKGLLQPFGPFTALTSDATESTPYIRSDYLNGNRGELCTSECYEALVTPANVPSDTKFGGEPKGTCEEVYCGPEIVGATSDLSHVVLASRVALTSTHTGGDIGLYEWSAGRLEMVSLLPAEEPNENGGSAAILSMLGRGNAARHAISDDGSQVIWTGEAQAGAVHLYAREMSKGETVRIDVPNAGVAPPTGEAAPLFMDASSDGSRIFFLDIQRLTSDATTKEKGREFELYEYNRDAPVGSRITDLSVGRNEGESAAVSMVTGASEDGSYVFFTASGALAPGDHPGKCVVDKPGERRLCNLYVRHAGVTRLVAALSSEDFPDWSEDLGGLPARVSPDGRWLAFMSDRSLTGYDNTDAVSGHPDQEVYLYDAVRGELTCASCNPTNARPVGFEYGGPKIVNANDQVFPSNAWIASNVQPWTTFAAGRTRYQSRYLSDSGRLFFDSHDALAPQDVNGTQDVYEYEPAGVGDCTVSSSTFSETNGGCVAPISSGISGEESAFLDASGTGGDVFFLTAGKLLAQDFDNAYDIYDARECVPRSRCYPVVPAVPPPCTTGDSCKSAPSPQPPVFGAPASATFSGVGNFTAVPKPAVKQRGLTRGQKLARALRACHRKRRHRRRVACEGQARKRYGASRSASTRSRG